VSRHLAAYRQLLTTSSDDRNAPTPQLSLL